MRCLGGDHDWWLVVFEEVLVGANSAHFSCVSVVFIVGVVWAPDFYRRATVWHGPTWILTFAAMRTLLVEVDGKDRAASSWRSADDDA